MPEISLFYGIRVTMYYNDHMPPHFHAEYNGQKALVDINNIQVIRGSLPNKQSKGGKSYELIFSNSSTGDTIG